MSYIKFKCPECGHVSHTEHSGVTVRTVGAEITCQTRKQILDAIECLIDACGVVKSVPFNNRRLTFQIELSGCQKYCRKCGEEGLEVPMKIENEVWTQDFGASELP